jgi:hypothetical protein
MIIVIPITNPSKILDATCATIEKLSAPKRDPKMVAMSMMLKVLMKPKLLIKGRKSSTPK